MTRPPRQRELILPAALVEDLDLTFALGRRLYPEHILHFSDWLQAVLVAANEAIRQAYEQEAERRFQEARDGNGHPAS